MIEIVSDQFLNGKFRVDEKCRQYKSPHCIERRIAVSASVEENATGSVLLEEPESLLGYLQYGERCQIVIEVVDVIPYINVLRNFLPLIQLLHKLFFLCILAVYPSEWKVYGTDNDTCIGRQLFVRNLLGAQIGYGKKGMFRKALRQPE